MIMGMYNVCSYSSHEMMGWSTTTVKEVDWYSNAGLRIDIYFGHFMIGGTPHTDVSAQFLHRIVVHGGDGSTSLNNLLLGLACVKPDQHDCYDVK